MITVILSLLTFGLLLLAFVIFFNRMQKIPESNLIYEEGEDNGLTSTPIEITSQMQFQQAVNMDELTLVDFYATWCGPCNSMHPVLEELAALRIKNFKVIKVDIDYLRAVASYYTIQSVPTLMLFHNGILIWRHSGVAGLSELKYIIGHFQTSQK